MFYERMRALYAHSTFLSEERRDGDMQQLYMRRRRAWLWRPAMWAGLALLTWQVTLWEPSTPLVLGGIVLCLPWVVDC